MSSVCRRHSLKIFSSETTGPIEPNLYWVSMGWGNKSLFRWSLSHDQDGRHAISGTKRPITLKLGMQHRVLEYYQVCSKDVPELTLTYFMARSNLVPYAFVWEKGKTMHFSETIVAYDFKLATDDRSDKKFLLTSKLYPRMPLPRGYIHVLNHEEMFKIRLQRDFFKTCNKWQKAIRPFCWHQTFVP